MRLSQSIFGIRLCVPCQLRAGRSNQESLQVFVQYDEDTACTCALSKVIAVTNSKSRVLWQSAPMLVKLELPQKACSRFPPGLLLMVIVALTRA